MNKYLLLSLIPLLFVFFNTSVLASNALGANDVAHEEVKHVFGVHGLSCPFCVIGIKKTLKEVAGVQSVEVSLKNKTVTVYTKRGICFSDEQLKEIFSRSGFSYHGTILKPQSCTNSR